LGRITYEIYRFDEPDLKLNVAWYVAIAGLDDYFYPDGTPIFIVSSKTDQWWKCEVEARQVLRTLHKVE